MASGNESAYCSRAFLWFIIPDVAPASHCLLLCHGDLVEQHAELAPAYRDVRAARKASRFSGASVNSLETTASHSSAFLNNWA